VEDEYKGTFKELKKIANTVFVCVQFTYDTPFSHEAGMFPMLDLQVYIDQEGKINYLFKAKCQQICDPQSISQQQKM
jgi:hypothetical protein